MPRREVVFTDRVLARTLYFVVYRFSIDADRGGSRRVSFVFLLECLVYMLTVLLSFRSDCV